MKQWSGVQCAFPVKAYYKNGSVEAARRAFRRQFNIGRHGRVPSAHAINTWVRNFEETDPLHRRKVTVWCAVSSNGVGRYIIEDDGGLTTTVMSIQYAGMLENFIVHELHNFPQQTNNTWFQQDGATAHTARISMATV
jgi:hypothetical protein